MQQQLLTIAELLQGVLVAPAESERTKAQTEVLLESQYEDIEVWRFNCVPEADHEKSHVYRIDDEMNAETVVLHIIDFASVPVYDDMLVSVGSHVEAHCMARLAEGSDTLQWLCYVGALRTVASECAFGCEHRNILFF